jgi:tRNA(Leu) C34 or U34 (ribose-2'-O)-methylase TrmL
MSSTTSVVLIMAKLSQIKNRLENVSFGVLLDRPKNSFNIGAVLRTVGAFGGNFVAASEKRFLDKGDWKTMDTEAAHLRLPCFLGVGDLLPFIPEKHTPVAIELSDDAVSLFDFQHPTQAVYFFGPEDGSLSETYLNKCVHKIYIPTKYSLNLAQTVNIVAYDRAMKLAKRIEEKVIRCPFCDHNYYTKSIDGYTCNACGQMWKDSIDKPE